MKTSIKLLLVSLTLAFTACDKKNDEAIPDVTNQYSSMENFYQKNGAPLQSFTVDATTGGTFVSAKGSRIEIPPEAFVTLSNIPVSGPVTIEFRDIYKKSDMVLSDQPTVSASGMLLKSGGEFFIKATQNKHALQVAAGMKLDIFTPQDTATDGDTAMAAFIPGISPIAGWGWIPAAGTDTVRINASQYVFSLYAFNTPVESGSWCNYDNAAFFAGYPQTSLILHALDSTNSFDTDVFLLFNSVKSMVHMYQASTSEFDYNYAPQGLSCTVVAVGVKNGKLYSSFIPTTVTTNQTINFSLTETTTDDFKTQLRALD